MYLQALTERLNLFAQRKGRTNRKRPRRRKNKKISVDEFGWDLYWFAWVWTVLYGVEWVRMGLHRFHGRYEEEGEEEGEEEEGEE